MSVRHRLLWSARVLAVSVSVLTATSAYAAGALSNLVVPGLTPAFDPNVTTYTVPKPASGCGINVTATLEAATNLLYIQGNPTTSGATRSAYICDNKKIDIVVYKNWVEVGRYTITPVAAAPVPPPPPPPALSALVIANLSPMFAPATKSYTIPRTAACSVPVTATLSDPTNKLYVSNAETASGATRQAWVCDGKTKIDVVVYKVWTEVDRYTIDVVGSAPPPSDGMGGGMNGGSTGGNGGTYTPPPTGPTEAYPTAAPAPVYNEPQPSMIPADVATAQRLLHQASFGPTAAEMSAVMTHGVDYWLWQQFQKPASPITDGLDINALRAQVFNNMATGQDQLRQRVAFALSQILVVSANKDVNGYEMIPWMRLLTKHAFGNYRTLLREVTLSPSMGKYLDLANSKGVGMTGANENYPRELMQLFSLGIYKLNTNGTWMLGPDNRPIATYDQNTVREVARALTGWTYPSQPNSVYRSTNNEYFVGLMEPRPENHDKGAKTIFGTTLPANQSVTKDMDDVLDILFNHANMPPFVATRLIRSLVTSNPSPEYIERVAGVFVNDGHNVRGNLAAVVKAVLTDPDAALPGTTDGHLQDAIINTISLGRALDATFGDAGQFMYILSNLGQHLLTPNSVFGWYSPLAPLPHDSSKFGPEFMIYSPAASIQRANFVYALITNQIASGITFDLSPFVALAGNPTAMVELINQKLFQGRMSNSLRQLLVTSAGNTSDMSQRAIGAVYLAAISSEYLVHAQ